jgi:chemotaxis protein methyltransferase CheR
MNQTTHAAPPLALTPEQFTRMRDLIASFGGVYLDAAQQRVLEAALAQRLAATGERQDRYEQLLASKAGREELRRLSELILNHETFFFRNMPHLRALRAVLLPEMHRRKPPGEPIRIWSAGCATGEEPYSIAITALEALGTTSRPLEVYGTDLSMLAIEKARAGLYRGRALNNLSSEQLRRFFQPAGDGLLVAEPVRSLVTFAQLNLLDPFPDLVRGADAIFCQNVTIYFRDAARRDLIARFYACLPEEGLLFLGFSETLWNVFDGFGTREVGGAYVYYKRSSGEANGAQPGARTTRPTPAARPVAKRSETSSQAHQTHSTVPSTRGRSDRVAVRVQMPQSSVETDEAFLARARQLLDGGQIAEALEALRALPPHSPLAPRALTMVARAHADCGDLSQAVAEIRRSLEIEALNDDAYMLLGVIYGRQNDWPAAVRELERARYLNPASPLVSYHLADAYLHRERPELAAREYRSALWKLDAHPPDTLLDGVAVEWLRAACRQQLELLRRTAE